MKLFRFGPLGQEKTAVLINGIAYDTSAFGENYDSRFLGNGGLERLKSFLDANRGKLPRVPDGQRIGTPWADPAKIVCVGLNYIDHIKETGLHQEKEPILFLKAVSALTGPSDGIIIPRDSVKTDWETELAVVIGKRAVYITPEEAEEHILGYVLHNDISERSFQTDHGGTWDKGKGCDSFAPIGPWLVTKDEVADSNNMHVWLKLNGQLVQNGNTRDFIYKIPELLSYISRFMSLNPGDIVSTGSPAGVGMGMRPQRFLHPGDVIEYGIDGLGSTRQQVRAWNE